LQKKIGDLIKLPNGFVTNYSTQIANDLTKITMKGNYKLITCDSKDLYVNLPIQETLTSPWLNLNNIEYNTGKQCAMLFEEILNQNYFHFGKNY
jgi:hypothetical protein